MSGIYDPTVAPRCPCGSGRPCRTLHGADGKFIALVCDVCEARQLSPRLLEAVAKDGKG